MKMKKFAYFFIPAIAVVATIYFLEFRNTSAFELPTKKGLRIATYNVYWLAEEIHDERKANLQSVIKNLDADIIGLQEVESLAALQSIFTDEWELGIMDDEEELQEVAIAVKKPLKIKSLEMLFTHEKFDYAFPNKRDLLKAVVGVPNGTEIICYVVHFKSRRGGRENTDDQRAIAASLVAAYVQMHSDHDLVVLMGDFNDTPDDRSLNILETGNLLAEGRMENEEDIYFVNLCEPLWVNDYVTFGLHTRARGESFYPKVPGARKENDKWRGKTYRYPDDLSVIEIMFDQILVNQQMNKLFAGKPLIYAGKDALNGSESVLAEELTGEVKFKYPGTLASDHLPVAADFRINVN